MVAKGRVIVLGLLISTVALSAQQREPDSPGARASFEVASVKPNKSGVQGSGTQWQPNGTVIATNVTLKSMIARAYEIREFQVDGPGWLSSARFDITARAPEGTSDSQRPAMLRSLLADRFKLAARFETREQPVFALVVRNAGRLGPQLKQSQLACSGASAPPEGTFCGLNTSVGSAGGRIIGGGMRMDNIAAALANYAVDQAVVNRTNLDGAFDFELQFARLPSNERPDVPSIFTAVQEQLGLRLEAARGPVQFLVIDKVEQPTPD